MSKDINKNSLVETVAVGALLAASIGGLLVVATEGGERHGAGSVHNTREDANFGPQAPNDQDPREMAPIQRPTDTTLPKH